MSVDRQFIRSGNVSNAIKGLFHRLSDYLDTQAIGVVGVDATAEEINTLAAANANMTPGAGITGGANTVYASSIERLGSLIKTTILIDLTDLNGGGTAGDVIGTDGTGAAYLGQITAALNGTILGGTVECLETPAGSNVDVDLWAADENTGVEDTAISALTNEVQLINHGNWAVGERAAITAMPGANQYLYLTSGAATAGTFTAGKFRIELLGYDA